MRLCTSAASLRRLASIRGKEREMGPSAYGEAYFGGIKETSTIPWRLKPAACQPRWSSDSPVTSCSNNSLARE